MEDKVKSIELKLKENECSSNPCLNGGTCQDLYEGYQCHCPSNWEVILKALPFKNLSLINLQYLIIITGIELHGRCERMRKIAGNRSWLPKWSHLYQPSRIIQVPITKFFFLHFSVNKLFVALDAIVHQDGTASIALRRLPYATPKTPTNSAAMVSALANLVLPWVTLAFVTK